MEWNGIQLFVLERALLGALCAHEQQSWGEFVYRDIRVLHVVCMREKELDRTGQGTAGKQEQGKKGKALDPSLSAVFPLPHVHRAGLNTRRCEGSVVRCRLFPFS